MSLFIYLFMLLLLFCFYAMVPDNYKKKTLLDFDVHYFFVLFCLQSTLQILLHMLHRFDGFYQAC